MLYVITAILVLDFVLGRVLSVLNASYEHLPIPEEICDIYNEERHSKQVSYAKVNRQLSWLTNGLSLLIMLLMLYLGGFRWIDLWVHDITSEVVNPIWRDIMMAVCYFSLLELAESVISIPISVYRTFVVEQRFGFNTTTPTTFTLDWLKSTLLQLLLISVVLAAVVGVYDSIPDWFWLVSWAVVAVISVFVSYFYSQLIVPLFNKQTPLPQGELRDAIEKLAAQAGFHLTDIYVMDSSKRTTHANAYFAGFGKKRRIVLYDTLIEQLSTDEIVAVLAHEIGHSRHNHTAKAMATGLAQQLLMFVLLGLALRYNLLAGAIGCEPSFHVNMFLFSILYEPLSLLLSLLGNYVSRKNEYEADAFARSNGLAQSLVVALKKLSANSLSNPNPHPAFVFFYYSHPTLVQRIRALSNTYK
ncbi:MAG: M48 family metallopeptidase [Paludibacteraceae bacterium]|nr:M48 family metallopeptidase [Paludibacteraceae bacterium]